MLRERGAEPFEVFHPQRHGSAARDAVRRVREANEPLALLALEQLHDRREALVARPLRKRQLLDELRSPPGSRRLVGQGRHRSPLGVARV